MSPPVFISYARGASSEQARALHRALGGDSGLAFLDTSGIDSGKKFPPELVDALLASRVVLIFASEEYFQRRYCLWELEAALGGAAFFGSRAVSALEPMLASIIVALPSQGGTPELLPLPPGLRQRHWPQADAVETLVALVHERLAGKPGTLRERLDAAGQSSAVLRTRLLEQIVLPPPNSLAAARVYPRALPPSLEDSFIGRADDLWRIHYTLSVLRDERGTGASGAALTGALQGTGGFGKTRLALEYVHRFGRGHYPGGVFWVNADVGAERLEEQFHGILRTLEPSVPNLVEFRRQDRNATQEMSEALEALAATSRVLFVVDNVPEPRPAEVSKPLATWCPVIGKVSLLATSRVRLDLGTEGVHPLAVRVLEPEAAVALLMDRLERGSLDDAGWRRIAEWVGRMPLALELLNRVLRTGALTPEELLLRTEQQGPAGELDRQMEVLRRYVPPGALRGVTETFFISYQRLSDVEQHAARLIAHLAPEPIPVPLLEAFGPEVSAGAVRAALRSRHFVTPMDAALAGTPMLGSMHRLLADYLRSLSPEPLAELRRLCAGLLDLMKSDAIQDPDAWPLLNACLPHAELVFERLRATSPLERRGLLARWIWRRFRAQTPDGRDALLGLVISAFLSARGLAAQARRMEEAVVEYAEKTLGLEHPVTFTAMHNLAATLREEGALERARVLGEQVLVVSRRALGDEHPARLAYMSGLASTLHLQGNLSGARALREHVLDRRRRTLGEAHVETLTAMNDHASTLLALGELAEARALLEPLMEKGRHLPREAKLAVLTYMGTLASTLRAQANLKDARALQEQVVEERRRMLGAEHPSTLTAMSNLATTLVDQGDLEGGRALLEHVLKERQLVLGEAHPDTLQARRNLACIPP